MTGLIILAAGASSRLGKPKQNLLFNGKTLLQHAVDNTLASVCSTVTVVLGANAGLIEPLVLRPNLSVIHNANWAEGMASSIRNGLTELIQSSPELNAIVLMLCDQPFVDAALIDQLVMSGQNNTSGIAACAYDGTVGPPAYFSSDYFDELLGLTGNDGAKKVLLKYADNISTVRFDLGSVDIDTIDEYDNLINRNI